MPTTAARKVQIAGRKYNVGSLLDTTTETRQLGWFYTMERGGRWIAQYCAERTFHVGSQRDYASEREAMQACLQNWESLQAVTTWQAAA